MIDKLSEWGVRYDIISFIFFGEPEFPDIEEDVTNE